MTASESDSINLGSLTASVIPILDEAALLRSLEQIERDPRLKITIRSTLDSRPMVAGLTTVRDEMAKLSSQSASASREQIAAERQGQQLLRDRAATLALNTRLAAQAEREQREAARAALAAQREVARQEKVATDAAKQAHADGLARLRERIATETMNARFRRDLERQAAADARATLLAERERQRAASAAIQALVNEQQGVRSAWQAGKIVGVDLVAMQQDIRRRALDAAEAVDKETAAYRRLTGVAAGAQRSIDSATGRVTPGGFAAGVRTGIQESGLFNQIAALGALGPAAQNLGIVSQAFLGAKSSALEFGGATNTAATATGFLTAGAAALTLGVAAAGAGLVSLGKVGLEQTKILQGGLNTLQANGVQDLGAFQDSVRTLKTDLGEVGKSLSLATLTASAADLVKANLSASDSLVVLAGSSKLAAAEGTNLNQTSAQLLMNTRQYGLEVSQAGRVADMFAKAGNLAAGTANDLSLGFGKVGGTGLQAGIAMNDLLGMLVELDLKGMSAADVGADALRTALSSLSDITDKGKGVLAAFNIAIDDASGKARPAGQIMAELGEKLRGLGITVNKSTGELEGNGEALRAVSSLMDTRAAAAVINLTGDWREHGQAIKDSEGYATEYARVMSQGVDPAQRRLKTALEDTGLAFAKTFAGPLADFLDKVATPLAENLGVMFDHLSGIKSLGELKTSITITAQDDATAQVLKLLTGGAVVTVQVVQAANQAADNPISRFLNPLTRTAEIARLVGATTGGTASRDVAVTLRNELVDAGVFKKAESAREFEAQIQTVLSDLGKHQQLLTDALNRNAAAIDRATQKTNDAARALGIPQTPTGAPRPLTGSGPLLPGQTRAVGEAVTDLVDALGLAGQRLLNGFGVSGKDYHHDGAVSANAIHRGVDIGAPRGTPITAPFAGEIRYRQDARNGKVFELVDALGNKLVGIHMDEFDKGVQEALRKGGGRALVLRGQKIGTVGNTGTTAGSAPHLHFEGQAAGSTVKVDPRTIAYAGVAVENRPVNTTTTARSFTAPTDQALIAEARRILTKIEGYERSGNLTGKAAAERVLKAFTEADPRAAAAIDYARSKLSELTTETSKFGQGYDALKARLGQAESLFKINADPAAYARSLEAISTAAQQAAATEKKQFGQTDKYSALYDLAGDAAGKARQQREALSREQDTLDRDEAERTRTRLALQRTLADTLAKGREEDAQRLLEQLKTAQGRELALFEGNAAKQVAILTRTGPAIVAAEQRLANLRRDVRVKEAQRTADEAKALPGADLAAIEATRQESVRQAYAQARSDRQKALDDQAKVERQAAASLAKEQQALRAKYNAERRDLDVAEQQATLSRTVALNQRELEAFRGTQTQRVALIKRQAQDEYNAHEQVARAVRDKARAEAINLGGPNVGRTLAGIDQTYTDSVDTARSTQDTANRQALEGQAQAVRAAREAYAQLATGMREKIAAGRVEMADLATYRTGLDAADTAARRAGVSTDALITGARASAAAVLELGVDVSATAPELDGLSDAMNRVAGQNVRYAVTLDRALQLIPGSVEANRIYVAVLADLERQGVVSAGTVAAVTEAIADQEVVATLNAEALTRLTQEAVTAAQGLEGAGDSAEALDTLTAALDAAMDASMRGEDAAEAIGRLTDEINRLTADQAVTDTLNTFVAGLSGTIDEQIAQTVAYVESVTDPKLLAKAKAFLADLRGQLPTYAPYAIPGQGPAPVSDGPDYQTIAAARDLKAQLELETDPAQLQGLIAEITALLASEMGQRLPEATKAGLQAGITDAETYIGIQQGVGDAAAQGIRDGALRGTADAPPVPALPTSQYDALIDRVYELGDALKDPVQLQGLTESLQASRRAGELTEEQLQNLLALARDFAEFTVPPELQATLAGVQERVQTLTDDFDAGRITAAEFSAGLAGSGDDLGVLATEAEKLGNVKLAGMIRDFAASLRGLNPEIAGALKAVGKVQEIAGYVIQVAGAFGQFAAAMGEAEQDYDRFTGDKLQTPWKDLAANLQGIQSLAQTVATVATDVMKLITNPADIGAWISLITTVVSSIADAIAGFKKAQAEVQKLKDDFAADNPFLNPEDYQKAFARSRGFFADLFGGGPEVVNEIDKIGLSFAKTMQGAFASGIKEGLTEAIKKNDISLFSKTLKVAVGDAIISGIVESFIQSELIKNILAPAIKAWSDALKTTDDPNDDIAAAAGLDAAVGMVDQQASAFATQVLPRLETLRDKGYFGESGGTPDTGSMFGAAPDVQLGLGRVEVQFAADDLRGLHDLRDQVVPIMVSSFSDFRLMVGEFRQALASSGTRGAPPLSGLGGF